MHSSPTGVAGDVHDGRKRLEYAYRPQLTPLDFCHLFYGLGIPSRCEPDRGGEVHEVGRHHAVQRLIVEGLRDLEAGLRDEIALYSVNSPGDLLRRLVAE
jgi:hypothetical protein